MISVENLRSYTTLELLLKLTREYSSHEEILNYLMDEGLEKEVVKAISDMLDEGEITTLLQDMYANAIKISVKNYGAVGDGKHDDTVAIQNCIDDCIRLGKTVYFPNGTYKITKAPLNTGTKDGENLEKAISIEGESATNTKIIYEGSVPSNPNVFDFSFNRKVSCQQITSNLGFLLIPSDVYFKGEQAWRQSLREKEMFLENCLVEGDFVQQGYSLYLHTPSPDSYERYSNPKYTRYPLEITNGSGYNAININNFMTNQDGTIGTPQDNSAIGIVDACSNSTGVIFIDMMGDGRSFERYVSRNAQISSNVRPQTVWEIHRNGHLAIGCSVDESEFGWNTVKLRDNSPSIRLINANDNNRTLDIGIVNQEWGEEFYIKFGNVGMTMYLDSNGTPHFNGFGSGGIDGGVKVNQDTSANWDNCLKIMRTDGKGLGLGCDQNEKLRKYYTDGNANLYQNGCQGRLYQEVSCSGERPKLLDAWTDYGYMHYDTNINKLIIWTPNGWRDVNGTQV